MSTVYLHEFFFYLFIMGLIFHSFYLFWVLNPKIALERLMQTFEIQINCFSEHLWYELVSPPSIKLFYSPEKGKNYDHI